MKFLYNDPSLKILRKKLRSNQTDAEGLLWSKLRNRQLCGLEFYRQYGIDKYVLDFYCPKLRLAIELDGGHHNEEAQIIYDQIRSDYLNSKNIKILRIWNNELIVNVDGVLDEIMRLMECNPSQPPLIDKGRGKSVYGKR